MLKSSEAFCRVFLIPRQDAPPSDAFKRRLSAEVLSRASTFTNTKRIADFLWGRLLLTQLLEEYAPQATLVEAPPGSPLIAGSSKPLYTTISHTQTYVGAALSTSPVAIDLEVMAAHRARQATYDRVFGDGAWEASVLLLKVDPTLTFYQMWGLYECAVKLSGRVTGLGTSARVEMDAPCPHMHQELPNQTLLTVVTQDSVEIEVSGI